MNRRYGKDTIDSWKQAVDIHRQQVNELQNKLSEAKQALKRVEACLGVARNPVSSRNVLFSHTFTSFDKHLENARNLGFPYVAWNDHVYTVDEVMIDTLASFGFDK
jgi:septation ring formation regulator EzrA